MAKRLPGKTQSAEVIPPNELPVTIWHRQFPPKAAWFIKAGITLPSLAFAGWLFQNFLQLRGFVNLIASRIDLAFLALSLFVVVWGLTIGVRSKKRWRALAAIIIALGAWGLDWLAPAASLMSLLSQSQFRW